MSAKPVVEIPVIGIASITVPADGAGDVIIGLTTEADADLRLKLSPQTLAEFEALLARAALEQAKRQPRQ